MTDSSVAVVERQSVRPMRVVDENGEIVWCGFGRTQKCSFAEASESADNQKQLKSIEVTPLQPNENAGGLSEKPDIGVGETRTEPQEKTRNASFRQRRDDPFMCVSIAQWLLRPITARETTVLFTLAANSDVAGRCHLSQQLISEQLGISRPQVSEAMSKLVEKKYITRTRRKGFNSVMFQLHPKACWLGKLKHRNRAVELLAAHEAKMKRNAASIAMGCADG